MLDDELILVLLNLPAGSIDFERKILLLSALNDRYE